MKNISLTVCLSFLICTGFILSCNESAVKENIGAVAAVAPDLNHVIVELPKAPGSQTFNANCVICHSAAYIQNQPDMPEKSWTAIVTKMQKTFGAPVSDSSAKVIIQYLVSIKGKK